MPRPAAAAAIVLVAVVGVLVRAPLARVPENTMKFAVGVMLTTFGIFWAAEGAGAHWPGNDVALLGPARVRQCLGRSCWSSSCGAGIACEPAGARA